MIQKRNDKRKTLKKVISRTRTGVIKSKNTTPVDWRLAMLSRVRTIIRQANPDVVEEIKWRKPSNPAGVPVWTHGGIICTGEIYKDKVKLTFARGALLMDHSKLFNASLDGNTRRAIDIREGDKLDEGAFRDLVEAAVELNISHRKR